MGYTRVCVCVFVGGEGYGETSKKRRKRVLITTIINHPMA